MVVHSHEDIELLYAQYLQDTLKSGVNELDHAQDEVLLGALMAGEDVPAML